MMAMTRRDIAEALRSLGLSGRAACLHSSLRSFGHVEGGAATVVGAFLDEGCTVLVPTFSSRYVVAPPPHLRFERNGWNYDTDEGLAHVPERDERAVYTPETADIDRDMGAIPAAVLSLPGRVRGNHPLDSFTAAGPLATELVRGQTATHAYAPLAALGRAEGYVVLMGVGLERMTLLHEAERRAGRVMFRRWARGADGQTMVVEVGGCSEGFGKLEPALRVHARTALVGRSVWRVFAAAPLLDAATELIRTNPRITDCGDATCERCPDAVAGGPILKTLP